MNNERIPHPSLDIMAISKQKGLIPTSAYARRARCYVNVEPVQWCPLSDPKILSEILQSIASKPVPEVDLTFEEAKESTVVRDAIGAGSWPELQAKSVYIGIDVLPDVYDLHIRRRNAKGEWLGIPYAFEKKFPKGVGMEPVAQAIVQHLQTRKDLPDAAYIPPRSIAQSA